MVYISGFRPSQLPPYYKKRLCSYTPLHSSKCLFIVYGSTDNFSCDLPCMQLLLMHVTIFIISILWHFLCLKCINSLIIWNTFDRFQNSFYFYPSLNFVSQVLITWVFALLLWKYIFFHPIVMILYFTMFVHWNAPRFLWRIEWWKPVLLLCDKKCFSLSTLTHLLFHSKNTLPFLNKKYTQIYFRKHNTKCICMFKFQTL